MRKVGDLVIAADSALGIVFGLAAEFLRGAAASVATVCQRLAEQRSEPPKLLAAAPDENPLMDLVDAEVHCPDCNCPTVCGCGRELYMERANTDGLPMWFHRDDDSPITQRCADIRDSLADAPVSHTDLAACITRVWVGGTHLGYIWGDPIASALLADYRITKK
ncbi:Uncharacterised protein [Mycobacteroides abscessus subsp. bolletii]|uniref:hypothetical protein n=1 Tax=Mycobacteroides abscessus TaxID=36809 RepID=UPI0009A6FB09|nr:hypothetical protein [Mycobacteroides abscessus]MDB2219049.1 hypothetical protein [Mycobacteroides abscessus subsp. abscessus]SKS51071.1 Uncharacterised protein [Mycobacteroides abscessus subsp. bolletii]SKY55400.1 Uncharacterised protein [Mycobacteroides abscessus subsp. bolletii]SLE09512.1 Uncharacterised protein [Mycobacteroides abscessus subsp. bolletii]